MKNITKVAELFKALGHPERLEILWALMSDGELSAGTLAHVLELNPSTVSKQLRVLQAAGAITVRVDGQHRFYRLSDSRLAATLIRTANSSRI